MADHEVGGGGRAERVRLDGRRRRAGRIGFWRGTALQLSRWFGHRIFRPRRNGRVALERFLGQLDGLLELWVAAEHRWLAVRIRFFDREGGPSGEQLVSDIRVSND